MTRLLLLLLLLTISQLLVKAQTGKFVIVTHKGEDGDWMLHPKKSILLAYGTDKFEYKSTDGLLNTFHVLSYKELKVKTKSGKKEGYFYKAWWIDEDSETRKGFLKIVPQDNNEPYQLIVSDYIEEEMLFGFYKPIP